MKNKKYQCLSCGCGNEEGEDICQGCGASRKEQESFLEDEEE
jgi:hypothetical protein